jgi:hypothetical protein
MNYIRPTNEVIDVITILPNVDLESDLNARLRVQPPSDEPPRTRRVWTWTGSGQGGCSGNWMIDSYKISASGGKKFEAYRPEE